MSMKKDTSWMDDSRACIGQDLELFCPKASQAVTNNKTPRQICAGCRVKKQCLDYALTEPKERFGFWGGMSEPERREYMRAERQRRRRRAA